MKTFVFKLLDDPRPKLMRCGRSLPLSQLWHLADNLSLGLILLLIVGWLALVSVTVVLGQESVHPKQGGQLLIAAGADTSAGFSWLDFPGLHQRCLIWDTGMLMLPDEAVGTRFGEFGLLFAYGDNLSGASAGKRMLFTPGRYRIDQALLLTDGSLSLYVNGGELDIEDGRIVYRSQQPDNDPRAQYLLLAGIVILVSILLLRARSRLRESRAGDS